MAVEPWSPAAFEDRYARDGDPWDFAGSAYEQHRYDAILDRLAQARYRAVFEPGCSVGELTARLATRCDELQAIDVSPTAVRQARDRCRPFTHVRIDVGSVTDPVPAGLDLVVLSEVGYYFDRAELDEVIVRLAEALDAGGELVACHWLGDSRDHQLHGSTVHERLHARLDDLAEHLHRHVEPGFLLEGWRVK